MNYITVEFSYKNGTFVKEISDGEKVVYREETLKSPFEECPSLYDKLEVNGKKYICETVTRKGMEWEAEYLDYQVYQDRRTVKIGE